MHDETEEEEDGGKVYRYYFYYSILLLEITLLSSSYNVDRSHYSRMINHIVTHSTLWVI